VNTTEQEFLDEIDCRFPYDDPDRCRRLIDRGIAISPNAAFGVLHKICRPPRSARAAPHQLIQLLDYWRSRFSHPLGDMMGEAAASMIHARELPVDDVMRRMRLVAQYPGLYAALAILAFSCDDTEDRLQPLMGAIREQRSVRPET
jgi:hypothetical protein